MSLLLFAIFENNIENHLIANDRSYVNLHNEVLDNYIKLLMLMYINNIILIASHNMYGKL